VGSINTKELKIFFWVVLSIGLWLQPLQADPSFFWGISNSAFQVEGHPAESDWNDWTHTLGKIADDSTADLVGDFWNLYDTDFALAQDLGANSFRISIAWERVNPRKNQWDDKAIQHYTEIFVAMRARGLEPIITLEHFVLPKWIVAEGGILSPHFPQYFSDYAEKMALSFSKQPASVHYWITFNEPNVQANNGYVIGLWPPGKKGRLDLALRAQFQMSRAHVEAARAMRLVDPQARIGIAQHWRIFQPKKDNALDRNFSDLLDFIFNRYFINAIVTGNPCGHKAYFFCPTFSINEGDHPLDFVGVNYYGRSIVSFTQESPYFSLLEGSGTKSDLGWEVFPQGMYTALKDASQYGFPILVTENGVADTNDALRSAFLIDHISYMKKAQEDGVNLIGYLHWSLTDNFEWAFGLAPRFGLVSLDYKDLRRNKRPSFYEYKNIIKSYGKLQKLTL
jgi:beta-glucosidase